MKRKLVVTLGGISTVGQAVMQDVVNMFYSKADVKWGEAYSDDGPIHGYSNNTYPVYTSGNLVDQNHYLTVSYYDNYDFRDQWLDSYTYRNEPISQTVNGILYQLPIVESFRTIGQVTGSKVKVLDGGPRGRYTWLKTINYFDEKYRIIQSVADNYKGGQDCNTSLYDFTGNVLETKTRHTTNEVSWTGLVNAIASGNNLLKTTVSNGWSAGGVTVQELSAGVDGWIECIISEENQSRAFGLTATNEGEHYTSIDYAFWHSPTVARFSENGSTVYTFPEMVNSGDVIRIERSGTDMNYYRNGQLLHTTHNVSTGKLVGDASISNSLGDILMPRASFISKSDSINRRFVYDHAGRLTEVWHRINAQPEVRITYNQYNELGQLIDKKLHSTGPTAANAAQSLDYRYNIRGWLTNMNEADLSQGDAGDPTDYFNFQLAYETQETAIGNTPMFNGNISAMKWGSNLGMSDEKMRAYKYSYDKMDRITGAIYKFATGEPAALAWTTPSDNSFSVTGYTYDLNGNIMSLTRRGKNGSAMDILAYDYGSGPDKSNQLVTVSDTGSKKEGFTEIDGEGNDYKYDNNGNLIWDKNKGGEEILKNGGFSQGSADWISTDTGGRLTFANDSLSVIPHATASATIRQDDVILTRSVYVVIVDVVRDAGNILINIGNGGNTSIATTGKTIFTKEAGNGNDFVVTIPTTFSGHIKSIEVKGVVVITYNHLNLPEKIVKGLQQSLRYIYDASGRKISQEVYDQAGLIAMKSDYEGEFFYENDTLKFVNHEEGPALMAGSAPEYQYNLKDHLGNVRLTFTTKPDYEEGLATLETANASNEEAKFLNYAEAIKVNYNLFDHTYDGTTGPTYYSTRLTGGNTNAIYGLAKSLSVMPGDTINIEVYAKYLDPNSANWTPALTAFMTAVSGGTAPSGTVVDGGSPGSLGSGSFPFTGIFDHSSEDNIAPKAYLNFIVFDRDFDPIISESGYSRITTASRETGSNVAHDRLQRSQLIIKEPGYVYIYLSNESETPVEVYFDDFKVEHIKSPVVQMDDYYPFGLTFNSYQRENAVEQRWKFQGQEHIDDLDLGWDSFKWRNHMPDIGRFFNIDPLAEKYYYNSPYAFSENKVVAHVELEGLESLSVNALTNGEVSTYESMARPLLREAEPARPPTGWDKILNGSGNVLLGSVGAIGSALYVEGTVGVGAALGGGTAFALSLGEVAIGFAQIADGISDLAGGSTEKSGALQTSSSLPGLVGNATGSEHAQMIDAVGGFVPGMLSGGNLKALKEGWSVIKSSENAGQATQNILSTADAAMDTKAVIDAALQEENKEPLTPDE